MDRPYVLYSYAVSPSDCVDSYDRVDLAVTENTIKTRDSPLLAESFPSFHLISGDLNDRFQEKRTLAGGHQKSAWRMAALHLKRTLGKNDPKGPLLTQSRHQLFCEADH